MNIPLKGRHYSGESGTHSVLEMALVLPQPYLMTGASARSFTYSFPQTRIHTQNLVFKLDNV